MGMTYRRASTECMAGSVDDGATAELASTTAALMVSTKTKASAMAREGVPSRYEKSPVTTGSRFGVLADVPGDVDPDGVLGWVAAHFPALPAGKKPLPGWPWGDTPGAIPMRLRGGNRSDSDSSGASGASMRPGPKCSKEPRSRPVRKTSADKAERPETGGSSRGRASDDEESASLASSRKRGVVVVLSSSGGSGEEAAEASPSADAAKRRRRGLRSARDDRAGQPVAGRLPQRDRAVEAWQLGAAGTCVADPPPDRPRSGRNQRRLVEAADLAEALDYEPTGAIAAADLGACDSVARGIERSKNIQGGIVGSFWKAVTELTAAVTVLGRRAGPFGATAVPVPEVARDNKEAEAKNLRLREEAARLREERKRLREELAALEARRSLAGGEVVGGALPRPVDSMVDWTMDVGPGELSGVGDAWESAPLPQRVPGGPGGRRGDDPPSRYRPPLGGRQLRLDAPRGELEIREVGAVDDTDVPTPTEMSVTTRATPGGRTSSRGWWSGSSAG